MIKQSSSLSLTDAPLLRLFARLAPAGILGMLIGGLYNFVDGVFVGQLAGKDALTAVTIGFPLVLLGQGLSGLVGVGSANLYSQRLGGAQGERASGVFPVIAVSSILLCGLFALICLPFLGPILGLLGADSAILPLAVEYSSIIVGGMILSVLGTSLNMLIRAQGHMIDAMLILASGALLNIALDPIFMVPLGMGLKGAAWATLTSQALSLILGIAWFLSPRAAVRLGLRPGRHFFRDLGATFSIGLSAMGVPILSMIQAAIIFRAVRTWGKTDDIAVIGAAIRIYQMMYIPIWGASQALQPVAATNFGAGRQERVRKAWFVFSLASTVLAVLLWIPVMAFPGALLSLFIKGGESPANGSLYLRLYLSSFPIYGFMMMSLTLFQSTKRAFMAAILVLGKFIVFFLPPLLILAPRIGAAGIYLASPIADLAILVLGLAFLSRSDFRRVRKPETGPSPASLPCGPASG